MTAAQKTAKANFKKAIEYRKKTGVSLKEAFAHVYGKKVGAVKKKAAPKKKAAVKKAAAKKKPVKRGAKTKVLVSKKQYGTSSKKYDKRHQALTAGKRKTAWGTTYYESRANRSDKGALLGIGAVNSNLIEKWKQLDTEILKYNKIYGDYVIAKRRMNTLKNKAAVIQYNKDIKRISDYLKELKKHKAELKKLL